MTEAGLLQLQFIANADPVLCQIYSAYVLSGCISMMKVSLQIPAHLSVDSATS